MKIRTLTFALVSALAIGSVAACGGTAAETQPQTSASAATRAPIGQSTHGLVKVFGDAFADVPLRPEQRADLEKLASAAEARHQPLFSSRKEIMTLLADQIEKGQLDRAALEAKLDKVSADAQKIRAEDEAALVKVHALLDKDQRAALADALESRMHGAHKAHRGGPMGHFGKMKELADELKLTDEQRAQIFATFKDARHEMRERHARAGAPEGAEGPKFRHDRRGPKLTDALREDQLDVTKLRHGPGPDAMKSMMSRGVTMGEKVLPILTPEQRKILADKIRSRVDQDPAAMFEPPAAH